MEKLKCSIKKSNKQDLDTSLSTKKVSVQIGKNTYIARDHSKLDNLEYSKSGHTGFAGIEINTTEY